MNTYKLNIPLENDGRISLVFRQYQINGDWICQMDDEFKNDIENILENEKITYE